MLKKAYFRVYSQGSRDGNNVEGEIVKIVTLDDKEIELDQVTEEQFEWLGLHSRYDHLLLSTDNPVIFGYPDSTQEIGPLLVSSDFLSNFIEGHDVVPGDPPVEIDFEMGVARCGEYEQKCEKPPKPMKLAIGFWAASSPGDSFTLSREVTNDDTEAIADFLCAEAKIDREWLHTLLVLESDTPITIETREVM